MSNFNSVYIKRIFAQQQSTFLNFNNSGGSWTSTNAKLLRQPEGGFTLTPNRPYTQVPYVWGGRGLLVGAVPGRKDATWDIRNMPLIPSGTAGTVPDIDPILQNVFGQTATVVSSTSATYGFSDTGYLPFSLFEFPHNVSTLTARAAWGCICRTVKFNFNQPWISADFSGQAGYVIDSTGFSAIDTQGQAGLTAFPTEPSSPSTNGSAIPGFGNGYTATINSDNMSLKIRVFDITVDTGQVLVGDLYGSAYPVAIVGDRRTVSMAFDVLDDDSSALNDLKTQADTDGSTINATIVAGNTAGSIITWTIKNINLSKFGMTDSGPLVSTNFPQSFAHVSSISATDDMTLEFS